MDDDDEKIDDELLLFAGFVKTKTEFHATFGN